MRTRSLALTALLALPTALPGALPATAEQTTTTRTLLCDGPAGTTMAMENEYITGTGFGGCWFHIGHHTYDLDGLFEVGTITVHRIASVEVQFTPPIETSTAHPIPITFEVSRDGRTWEPIGALPYNPLSLRNDPIRGTLEADATARYLRIRQPRSAAQGLSGYLDGSHLDVELTPVDAPSPPRRTGTFSLACATDIMERFHAEHPCWFGGINRYDSPSIFHTYPLDAPTTVTSITGTATFLPWRSDDYAGRGSSRTEVDAHLFASVDGEHWTRLTTFTAQFGLPAAITWTGHADAAYLRIVAEYHRGARLDAPLKHARGMLLDSGLTVTAS